MKAADVGSRRSKGWGSPVWIWSARRKSSGDPYRYPGGFPDMRVEAQSPIAGSPEARASGSGSKRRFSDQDEIPFYASDIRLDTERDAGGSV